MEFEKNSFEDQESKESQESESQDDDGALTEKWVKSQPSIDQLTMELMMNKTHYHKYLSKQNPQKYQEAKETANKVSRYYPEIMEITETLLADFIQNSNEKYTREVNDVFQDYVKTCLKYLEMRDLERDTCELFKFAPETPVVQNSTFWGKPIRKMG